MGEKLTDIIFIRHAQSEYGADDRNRPLAEEGLLDRQIVKQFVSFLMYLLKGDHRYGEV